MTDDANQPLAALSAVHGDLVAATVLLTRLPVAAPETAQTAAPATARSYWAFAVVGVGAAGPPAILGVLLAAAGIPLLAAAAVVVAATAFITGGMHQDGLADTADGLGGRDPGHRLAIMRDSGLGSYGVLALAVVTIAIIAAVAALAALGAEAMVGGVVAAAALSRAMMAVQRWLNDTPDDSGLAHRTGRPDAVTALLALAAGVLVAAVFIGPGMALAALLAGGAVTVVLGWFLNHWVGGVNGDGLGATQQLSEAAMLVLFAALLA